MSVFVTDADMRQVLAIIRSLGKKGIATTVGDSAKSRFLISFFSKYCKKRVFYPSPAENAEAFGKELLKYVAKNRTDVLITVTDHASLAVSRRLREFRQYVGVAIPPYETLIKTVDKAQTMQFCEETYHPVTVLPRKVSEIYSLSKKMSYPLVVKPRFSSGSRGLKYATNSSQLIRLFKATANMYGVPLIQEYIPGDEIYGVGALLNQDSKPRAAFVYKRLRQFPISGGPSTYRVSVLNPAVQDLSLKILQRIKWYGVAMLEFKIDPRDSKPKLMEINPRFWGSLNLAIAAGVDFPYLFYKMAVEGDVRPVFTYKLGVKARYLLFGDVFHFVGSSNKLRLLPDFLKFYEKDLSYDICQIDDPLPAVIQAMNGFRYVFSREMWQYAYFRP